MTNENIITITYRTEHGCRMEWSDMAGPQRVAPKHSGQKVEVKGNEVRLLDWQYSGGPDKGWSPINMGDLTVYKAESVDSSDNSVYFVRDGVHYAITGLRKI